MVAKESFIRLGALIRRKRTPAASNWADQCARYREILYCYRELEGTALAQFKLSPREYDVALQLLHGATYREIARTLSIAESTVRFHAQNIFRKAEVKDRRSFEYRVHSWLNQWAEE